MENYIPSRVKYAQIHALRMQVDAAVVLVVRIIESHEGLLINSELITETRYHAGSVAFMSFNAMSPTADVEAFEELRYAFLVGGGLS